MVLYLKSSIAAKALRISAFFSTTVLIAIPVEAQATNIYYTFAFTGIGPSIGKNLSGVFLVSPGGGSGSTPDLIVGIDGTVYGFQYGGGSFNTLLPVGGYNGNDNKYSPSAPYLSVNGVAFQSDGVNYSLKYNGTNYTVINGFETETGTMTSSAISN